MRLAGSEELHSAIGSQVGKTDDEIYESKLEAFLEAYARLTDKGFDDNSAAFYAEEMANGREPMVKLTRRFAAIYGRDEDAENSSGPDRGG